MAKLWADIIYKWRKQESVLLKSIIDNIKLEQHTNLLDNLEEDKETKPDDDNRSNVNCETEEKIDGNIEDDVNDIDIEGVEHPTQNKDAKWKLDIIFKDNLHCPF
ncbi:hypothetical protein GLOIN_2v1472823 [Rhizophagus clarus]|uniref:Uncharacterized protein n=1 Tax=Rhizophagus clarus TaxID=94130 RepID=A0A8H3R4S0_9GLOM|nr:hypothetical protein GLOIN_2v1472823 [Rhizophagus clarus]